MKMHKSAMDITGDRYGKLVALEPVKSSSQGANWRFQCDCGRKHTARLKDVRLGSTTSCGCAKRAKGKVRAPAIKRGDIFGELTVTKRAPNRNPPLPYRYFHARCSCGGKTIVRAGLLTSGQTRSCGHLSGRIRR